MRQETGKHFQETAVFVALRGARFCQRDNCGAWDAYGALLISVRR